MSECTGQDCTHPECVAARDYTPNGMRERIARLREIPPAKLSTMNRAERRAAMRGKRA